MIFLLNFSLFGLDIKNLYSLYSLKGNFSHMRISDIYVFLDTEDEIISIDTIERAQKSRYKIFKCKNTIDFVVTADKYGYILHNTGIEVVDFFKPSKPVFIECFKFSKNIGVYDPLKIFLAEKKDVLYVNYGSSKFSKEFLPVSIKRRYEPKILNNSKNRSFLNNLFMSSYILKITSEGFEVISTFDIYSPKTISFYSVKNEFNQIKSLQFDSGFVYLQYDDKVDVVDLKNPLNPVLIKTFLIDGRLMEVKNKKMFVANGSVLKIKDIKNMNEIKDLFNKDLGIGLIKDVKFYNNFIFVLTNKEFDIYSPIKIPKPKSALDQFIERLYKDILKREPDKSGFDYWKRFFLNGGRASKAVGYFFSSDEFKKESVDDDEFLKRLYNTVFSRNPDIEGYNYWIGKMEDENMSRKEVIKKFILSKEFQKLARNYGIQP